MESSEGIFIKPPVGGKRKTTQVFPVTTEKEKPLPPLPQDVHIGIPLFSFYDVTLRNGKWKKEEYHNTQPCYGFVIAFSLWNRQVPQNLFRLYRGKTEKGRYAPINIHGTMPFTSFTPAYGSRSKEVVLFLSGTVYREADHISRTCCSRKYGLVWSQVTIRKKDLQPIALVFIPINNYYKFTQI